MAVTDTFSATTGNTALAGAGTATVVFDTSTKYDAFLTVQILAGGTVSTTAGVQVDIYPGYGTTPTYATTARTTITIPVTAAGATTATTINLGNGKFQAKLTNLDVTNGVNYATALTTTDSI